MKLPRGRCSCHEPTVKWCGSHGQPLKLRPGERVMTTADLWVLREVAKEDREAHAAHVRKLMEGR